MRLLGHEPEKVIWILGWLEEVIAGLRLTLDDGSTQGTAGTVGTLQGRSTTVCEGLCSAVEAEVEGIGTHVHGVVCCAAREGGHSERKMGRFLHARQTKTASSR